MSASWFRGLAAVLADGTAACVATVMSTRGAVPRHRGAMLWCTADTSAGTVGGGLLEARVLERARLLLRAGEPNAILEIDLGGGPDSAGVCGGRVRLALSRWQGVAAAHRAKDLADTLDAGQPITLSATETGEAPLDIAPEPLLLILGAGHCGSALARQAGWLGFRLAVFDPRADLLQDPAFATARTFHGDPGVLVPLLADDTLMAVLLNRDWPSDVACLRTLAESPPRYVGMMGSQRRVHQVRSTIPELVARFPVLDAPLGIEIGAETPEEIAVSILARLVAFRRLGPSSPPKSTTASEYP